MPPLSDDDRIKLQSCIEAIRDVIGDAPVSDRHLVDTVLKHNFDYAKSLDEILNDMSQKQEPLLNVNEKKETIEKGEYFRIFFFSCIGETISGIYGLSFLSDVKVFKENNFRFVSNLIFVE